MRLRKLQFAVREITSVCVLVGGLGLGRISSDCAAAADDSSAAASDCAAVKETESDDECGGTACAAPALTPAPSASADTACGVSSDDAGGGCANSDWCDLGEPLKLFGDSESVDHLGGWFQFGYHSASNGLFNNHDSQFGLHQAWLYLEREANGDDALGWGYRADVVYGLDGPDTQAFGNNPGNWDLATSFQHGSYGWAIPQAYLEFAYKDWSVTAGHFYTLVGYEVVTAPDNFFYSHAYTMYNSEPFTHTGVLTTYGGLDKVEVYAGWTAGWDTAFDRMFGGDNSGGSNFLGGASMELTDKSTLTYITTIGDFGHRGEGYSHSLVLDMSLTEQLNYVVQSDLVETTPDVNSAGANHQFGLNQYLLYSINDCVGAGARIEWWKSNGNSQYEATFGINYRPHANLVLRPEVRHDWNPGVDQNRTTFGMDMIVTF